jgi:hypothetical protein
MTPEFTKPTTMTVVAEEDCMTAVTPRPRESRIFFCWLSAEDGLELASGALFQGVSPMSFMPKRKRLRARRAG